ncbi:MAG: class I SAM-dependent methyltransferase [Methanospirillum sp.]|nr:class I SAM-dependent methyltransferase [Methanospirillum sp.]
MKNTSDNRNNTCKTLWEFPPVHPDNFFSTMSKFNHGARLLCLIGASVRLGIFDILEDWKSEKEIENFIKYPHPATDFFHSLIKTGLVDYKDEKIRNTPVASTYLNRQSPYFQGAYIDKSIKHLEDLWINLSDILMSGPESYDEEEFFATLSLPSMAQNTICGRLQEVVREVTSLPSFFKMKKMIDLGGGHGLYSIALACHNPDLNATVFDLPGVIPLAEEYIKKYNLTSRVKTKGGNFFNEPIGKDYDLIISSSNPSGKRADMLEKISDALKNDGFFVSIQPGDEITPYDPLHELEFFLWTFNNENHPKKTWTKNKKFLTDEYLAALKENKLNIHSITRVSDPYVKDYKVTMMIAQKIC